MVRWPMASARKTPPTKRAAGAKAAGERLDKLADELKLTPKQRRFARALAQDPERNRTKAARAAPYGSPGVEGCLALKNPKVAAFYDALTAEARALAVQDDANAVATAAEILAHATACLRFNVADALRQARDSGDTLAGLAPFGGCIDSIAVKPDGTVTVKASRRVEVMTLLARLLGMEQRRRDEDDEKDAAVLVIVEDFGARPAPVDVVALPVADKDNGG